MSDMKQLNQRGAIDILLIPLILVSVLLIGAAGFAYWAFNERQDYKNNSDQKVATAVTAAESRTQAADAKKFAEEAKSPLKKYIGPAAFGSVTVEYPKTWSSYVVEGESQPLNGYFHPDFVPSAISQDNTFALRVELVQQSYDQVLQQYAGNTQQQTVKITPYSLPKVPSIVGARIEGKIATNKDGVAIILPLRNMTLKISTESSQFVPDFNNIILPNVIFTP
jgi:hypothetical protein